MKRRHLILLLGGASIGYPFAARAQQPKSPVVGFLRSGYPLSAEAPMEFRKALSEFGYTDGQNIAFVRLWAENRYDRLPILAAELVDRGVTVIIAEDLSSAAAAKAATPTIPVVFWMGADPVAQGLVASLAHPGGNLTGIADFSSALGAKRLELLRELLPKAALFGLLVNPANPNAEPQSRDVQEAVRTTDAQIHIVGASTKIEIETAFAALTEQHTDALIVAADPFFYGHREHIVALAARHALPTIYTVPGYVLAGGLISYSGRADEQDVLRQMGRYTGRILKGEKPGDLPVIFSTRFQLAINLKTAAALGLSVPHSLMMRADEVIE
jgi:putative ABC transport system substrate-binding protein